MLSSSEEQDQIEAAGSHYAIAVKLDGVSVVHPVPLIVTQETRFLNSIQIKINGGFYNRIPDFVFVF